MAARPHFCRLHPLHRRREQLSLLTDSVASESTQINSTSCPLSSLFKMWNLGQEFHLIGTICVIPYHTIPLTVNDHRWKFYSTTPSKYRNYCTDPFKVRVSPLVLQLRLPHLGGWRWCLLLSAGENSEIPIRNCLLMISRQEIHQQFERRIRILCIRFTKLWKWLHEWFMLRKRPSCIHEIHQMMMPNGLPLLFSLLPWLHKLYASAISIHWHIICTPTMLCYIIWRCEIIDEFLGR